MTNNHRFRPYVSILCCVLTFFCLSPVFAQPFDNPQGASQAQDSIQIQLNQLITLRDGIEISVDIYRPSAEGEFPTLYTTSLNSLSQTSAIPNIPITGSIEWYVSHGFNYVIANVRGTGQSQGEFGLLSRDEQQDHYEIIEWIAQQQWSDGKVAGIGASYSGTTQWQMAIQNPPHLECIAPINSYTRIYQDQAFIGGLASDSFSNWYNNQVRLANAYPLFGTPNIIEYDLDLQKLLHPTYDDYWRLRSSIENINEITVPVFAIHGWNNQDSELDFGIEGTLQALEQINSLHKAIIYDTERYQEAQSIELFIQEELLAFYNWCLKGNTESQFTEQPTIRYDIRSANETKSSDSWPPQDIELTGLFLNRQSLEQDDNASLNLNPLDNNISISEYGAGTEHGMLTFTSEVLTQDMEISGPLLIELYASSSMSDTAFEVTLSEQIIRRQVLPTEDFPTFLNLNSDINQNTVSNLLSVSTLTPVSHGLLKASHRSVGDENAEQLAPQLLNVGQVTRMDIPMQTTAFRFKRGSRIVLSFKQASDGSLRNNNSQDTIFHNQRFLSRLWLPLVKQSISNNELSPADYFYSDASANTSSDSKVEAKARTEASNETPLDNQSTEENQRPAAFDFLNTESLSEDNADPIIFFRQQQTLEN